MTQAFKFAIRAATLQNIVLKSPTNVDRQKLIGVFNEAFYMGDHLWYKLTKTYNGDVAKWLRSLDSGNTNTFFESDKFDFLN